jgi:hypothetical protein
MRLFSRKKQSFRMSKQCAPRSWLRLEALEDRRVPATLSVNSAADDGSSATLRYAVNHAGAGDKIVLKGAALGGITLSQGELILNQNGLTIQTSSGQATISGGGVSRVVEIAAGANVTMNNLTITGGDALIGDLNNPYEGRGGGIVVDVGGALTMTGCTVTNNNAPSIPNTPTPDDPSPFAGGLGGGIADYGTLTMNNCAVTNNQALYKYGGGIAVFSGAPFSADLSASLTIRNSTVSGNTAAANGGGITGVSSTVNVISCNVTGNTATLNAGGGLNNHGGSMTVSHSSVTGNTAGTYGGGVTGADNYLAATQTTVPGTLTITGSDVSGNTAEYGGGIDNSSTLTLNNSTVNYNAAHNSPYGFDFGFGGGLFNEYTGTASLKYDVLNGNGAGYGGGIESSGTLSLQGCQLSTNTAGESGGAIDAFGNNTIDTCTLTNNSGVYGGAMYVGGTTTITNSEISGNTASNAGQNYPTGWGGGMVASGTTLVQNSDFSNNTALMGAGGIDFGYGNLTVSSSTLTGNTSNNGGALYMNGGSAAFISCQLSGNTAMAAGGAVDLTYGTLSFQKSTINGNTADTGGGIYMYGGTLWISGSTKVTNNTAATTGGGLYVARSQSTVTVNDHSSIVANTAPPGTGMDVSIQPKAYDGDSDVVFYLEGSSKLGDVFNTGILFKDKSSKIDHLVGNAVIPI